MSLSIRIIAIIVVAMLPAAVNCGAQAVYDGAAADDIVLLDEDFSRVVSGSMDYISYTGDIDDATASQGWDASAVAVCAGNFVFAPTLTPVTLATPQVQVNRAFPLAVSLTMAEYNNERYYTGATVTVSLLDAGGKVAAGHRITLTKAGYAVYDMRFDAPLPSSDVRVMICYDNDRSNRKLFLDRLTISQPGDASVDNVMCDGSGAWVSAPGEITVGGKHARVFSVDGRCLYDGTSTILHVDEPVVIAVVDGIVVKLRP